MHWLTRLFRKERSERQLDAELRFHLEKEIADNIASGMTPEEARRMARLSFGGVEAVKEEAREIRRGNWLDTLRQDLLFAARLLRKSRGFTAVAILTLALGIGANTAIFSIVQSVVLAPLPYRDPDRLVLVWLNNSHMKHITNLAYADFLDWRRDARSFEEMAAYAWRGFDLSRPGTPEHLQGREVSANFFKTLGVEPEQGREFSEEEDRNGGAPVAVISHELWRERFGGGPVLGKSIILDGVQATVIGVLPAGFRFDDGEADVYMPVGQRKLINQADRTIHDVVCVARLRPGISLEQADAEMDAVQENVDRLNPQTEQGLGAKVLALKEWLLGDVRPTLLLLLGAVGVVLLIACANAASLALGRATARTREFSIRAALGAGRGRIVQQLLTESMLLSLLGGALGLAVARWALSLSRTRLASDLPRAGHAGLNVQVLLFTLATALIVGILFGLAPALKSSRANLQGALRKAGVGPGVGQHRTQSGLVVAQMALTVVLLAGAGLLFRTIQKLWKADLGFDPQNLITFQVGLSPTATKTGAGVRSAFQQLTERIREIPGVEGAELSTLVPMSHEINLLPFWVQARRPASVADAERTLGFITGPDFQRVMGIPLVRGRFLSPQDTMDSPPVVVIDTELARTYFPNQDPIGQTLTFPQVGDLRIVGVVGHVQHWELGLSSPFRNQTYVSIYQIQDRWMLNIDTWTSVVVRTPLPPTTALPEIRKAVYGAASDQTFYHSQTMQEMVSDAMTPQRFPMLLLVAFAALALLLASIGIYGVISYSVTQRVQEIGIRMALGAERREVFRIVVGQGLRLAVAGLAIGILMALALTRLLSSFSSLLYGTGRSDPVTLVTVSLVLLGVAVAACYVPARRAARVDPIAALRYE